jgi:hypothetical protein
VSLVADLNECALDWPKLNACVVKPTYADRPSGVSTCPSNVSVTDNSDSAGILSWLAIDAGIFAA